MNPGSIEAKKQNIVRMLRAVYDHPEISRKELGQRFGLSASTVTLAINPLLEQRLLMESGQEEAPAGRRARLLRIDPEYGCILTIHPTNDLSVELRLCDLCGSRLAELVLPVPPTPPDQAQFLDNLIHQAETFLEHADTLAPLVAAAVIIPGVMNPDGTADIPVFGWEALQLQPLAEALQVPVFADTILHMLGGYEVRQITPHGRQIYLSLEPGVGMSCYEEGVAVTSRNLHYGEVGHISMHENGPLCYCGNRGCLEYYCGIDGILSRLAVLSRSCPILSKGPLTLEWLAEAAMQGSIPARHLLTEAATELGRGLVTILNILDPDQIIVSGRLWQIPGVRDTAMELVRGRILSRHRQLPQFLDAALSSDHYEVGVCHYVFDRLAEHLI